MRRPPLITTREEIKQKIELLEALGDIEIAMSVLQKSDDVDTHPLDQHYKELHCGLDPVSEDDEIFDLIRKFVKQTHGATHNNFSLEVQQIFEVNREGEESNFKDFGNRQLLWHGSRLTNWMGILSQGLRIAPPEAPSTGYMFGKGVYFSDMCSKSANYCFATPTRNEGLLLLCEVALGKPNELLAADYNAHHLPKGTHSVKGIGRIQPNPIHNHTLPDGCVLPLGPSVDTGIVNHGGYTLNYNEFIVYDITQVRMKYLIQLKFKF